MSWQVWVTPRGVTHAVTSFGPRTLCGKPLLDAWRRDMEVRQADDSTVECRRCRKALQSSFRVLPSANGDLK